MNIQTNRPILVALKVVLATIAIVVKQRLVSLRGWWVAFGELVCIAGKGPCI